MICWTVHIHTELFWNDQLEGTASKVITLLDVSFQFCVKLQAVCKPNWHGLRLSMQPLQKNAFLFDFEFPGKGKGHKEQLSTDSEPPLRKVYNVPETD